MMNGHAAIGDFASALNDPSRQKQVYQYLEAMKEDECGWRKSIDNIVTDSLGSSEEYFIMLQVVEDFVNTRYSSCDSSATSIITSLLSHCIHKVNTEALPPYLLNKMAHVFSLVFAADFPLRWPRFMQDVFLAHSIDSNAFALFYLKTLLAIDAEVVDRDIQRAPEVFDRNTKIKDGMRELCIEDMAKSWLHIMATSRDIAVQAACLEVISVFVDWIDIELVANDSFVPLLVERLALRDTAEAAMHAIVAVVQKKMAGTKKLPLVLALTQLMHTHKRIDILPECDDDDYARIGFILNAIGLSLIDCNQRLQKEGGSAADAASCLQLLQTEMSTVLAVLDHPEPDVSLTVYELAKTYATLLLAETSREAITQLERVVEVCLRRFEMGDDLDVDGDGELEADFQEYRKQLKQLIHPVILKRPELLLDRLEHAMDSIGSQSMRAQEATGQLVYALSELVPSSLLAPGKEGTVGRAGQLPLRFLATLRPSPQHAALSLLFFETAARYERLISREASSVRSLVPLFLAEGGIGHSSGHVRARVIYLFSRFVKTHRALLSAIVPEVIVRVAPLLEASSLLNADEQGYLFEATATLIVHGELSQENKAQYMHELASTLAGRFQASIDRFEAVAASGDARVIEDASLAAASLVTFAIKLTKAFGLSDQDKSMVQCGCADAFVQLLTLFVTSLTPSRPFLAEPCRQLGSRLLLCLHDESFSVLPLLIERLAQVAVDADSMQQLLILTQQIVTKHKKATPSSALNVPAVLSVAARLCTQPLPPSTDDTSKRAHAHLKRVFLQLLLASMHNDVIVVAAGGGEMLDELVSSACLLSSDPDASTQKAAVAVLVAVVTGVAKVGGASGHPPPPPLSTWLEKACRAALSIPLLPYFNMADATSSLVMNEVGSCILAARPAFPSPVDNLIMSIFPLDFAQQLITALASLKGKDLNRALIVLYTQIRD